MPDLEELLTVDELADYCEALAEAEEYKAKLKRNKKHNNKKEEKKDF